MDVRIVEDQAPEVRGSAVVFPALDLDGELEVWVTAYHWEDLWLQAPEPATDDDRLDYALGKIEGAASAGEASVATDSRRIRFVG